MERLCHLINKIYREMLSITRYERMSYVTMHGLGLNQVSRISWAPQYKIVLSWDLLDCITIEDKIPCSFTNFITSPELSGPLYISPSIYHTQITEYSLQTIYQWLSFPPSSNIFLIVILLDPPIFLSSWTGALGITFPALFQLKRSFIYSDQFV